MKPLPPDQAAPFIASILDAHRAGQGTPKPLTRAELADARARMNQIREKQNARRRKPKGGA